MTLGKIPILGVSVTTSSRQDILSYVKQKLSATGAAQSIIRIVTPNPEQIVLAQTNEEFRKVLNEAEIALPDGVGVVWAMKKVSNVSTYQRVKRVNKVADTFLSRISGVDFMVDLCRVAAEKNKRVLFYGGRNGASRQALVALKQQIPNLDGIAEDGAEISEGCTNDDLRMTNKKNNTVHNSYFVNHNSNEEDSIKHLVQVIRGRNIQVVFIGLGAPKQEFVISSLRRRLKDPIGKGMVLMSVGGSFDMLAGNVKRAPKVVQTMGFEWLYRLIQEPWRWRRQLSLLQFFWLVVKQIIIK